MTKAPTWVKWSLGGGLALIGLTGCSSNEPVNPPQSASATKDTGSPPPANFVPPTPPAGGYKIGAKKNVGSSGSPPPANFVPPTH